MLSLFYSSLCVCISFLLSNVDCWQVLQYGRIGEWAPVTTIPDPNWHFFQVCDTRADHFAADLTPSAPVLRYCALDELFRIYIKKGDPRFELLILMHHAKGEHLVNLTYDDQNVYLNNHFIFKCKLWFLPNERTELYIRKKKLGFELWADAERGGIHPIGNGPNENPEHEWQYVISEGRRCFEIKAKVAVGSVKFTVFRKSIGWPTEPYDDIFFETTTTTTVTTTITNISDKDDSYQESETTVSSTVNKASTMQGLIYAACGILVFIAAALLFFLGFRFGRCFARKRALKKGLLKSGVKESNASEPGGDTGAITPNASANQAESTKTPTKAVASTPTVKTNTEKNPVHAKSEKPRTPITPTTKDEVESSAVPTE